MRSGLFALLALACLCLPAWAQTIGRVDLVAGSVAIVDTNATQRSVKVGEPVQRGDTVTTGKDGEIHLSLDDGSVIAVRPEAKMQIVAFRFQGTERDGSVVSLLRGAMRTITGLLGRRHPKNVYIRTPTATIGIRGTDHEAFVIPPGSELGEPGTYDKVNSGGTFIRSKRGSVDVAPGQAAYAAPKAAPLLLPSVPAFFKPTANEGRLEGRDALLRGNGGSRKASKGGTQIQGNTRINATASNVDATAVGSDNKAGNRIGTIGGE